MIWFPSPKFSTSDAFLWSTWINSQKQLENTKESIWVRIYWSQKIEENVSSLHPKPSNNSTLWSLLVPTPVSSQVFHQGSILFLQWKALQPGREQTWTPSSLKELLMSFKTIDILDEFFSFPNSSCLLFQHSSLWLSFKLSSNSPHFSWVMEPIYSFGSHQ